MLAAMPSETAVTPESSLDLRSRGDRELEEQLLATPVVKRAIERVERDDEPPGARRQLLATSLRLTASTTPGIAAAVEECRAALGLDQPLECYVYPGPTFNAAAVRPEEGRLLILVSSALLEAFEMPELRFVIGHELGHLLFGHHGIPVSLLLKPGRYQATREVALRLFAWQRFAEISCDRAGLACCGSLEPGARALFKLASGLSGDRVRFDLATLLEQFADWRSEATRAKADDPARPDWFSTHPFNPLRLKALQLFDGCERMREGGRSIDQTEAEVQELMALMNPGYLQERSSEAETMRRLLFAAGVALAAMDGEPKEEILDALEELLGEGALPRRLKPDVIRADLASRVEAVHDRVRPMRRVQILRDLCVLARADGALEKSELEFITGIACDIDVSAELLAHAVESTAPGPS